MSWPTRPFSVGHLPYMSVTVICVSNSVIRLVVKFCRLTKIIFQVFCALFFFLKLTGELAMAYENYAGGILIAILIEIFNDYYLFYFLLVGNNEPYRMTPSTSSGQYRYSVSGRPALTTVLVF